MKEIRTAAIVGMGALGMLYADKIASAGMPVQFVADPARVEKYRNMKFTVNGAEKQFSVVSSEEAGPADLVMVAVKYNALPAALDTMKRCIGSDTTIISVMNGITSEEQIGERYGAERIIYSIAQGMDAVRFGGELTYSKPGELRIGIRKAEVGKEQDPQTGVRIEAGPEQQADRLEALTRYLDRCGIAYTVEDDILYRLWGKFMLNVGLNQTCMAYETNYGGVLSDQEAYETMEEAMREVKNLANAEGIRLTETDLKDYIDLVRTLSPEGMPSMRQDGLARRYSEVEMFAGTVRHLAARHGLAVPVNDRLYEKIKNIEAEYEV